MSGPRADMSADGDDDDALAAEYVLGVLDLTERERATMRVARDPGFASLVDAWEGRLDPLNAGFAEGSPPADMMSRIEHRLFGRPVRKKTPVAFWIGLGTGAAIAAAILAAFLALMPARPGPDGGPALTARLAAEDGALLFTARLDTLTGEITVRRTAGPPSPEGRDYQLWRIDAGAAPVPVALLRASEIVATLPGERASTLLAVSLEPEGGSLSGLPTGPILASAFLTAS